MKVIKTIFLSLLLSQIVLGQDEEWVSDLSEESPETPVVEESEMGLEEGSEEQAEGDYNPGAEQIIDYQCQEDGYFPVPTDNSKFVRCHDGRAYGFDCPTGLIWNTQTNICDWSSFREQDIYPINK